MPARVIAMCGNEAYRQQYGMCRLSARSRLPPIYFNHLRRHSLYLRQCASCCERHSTPVSSRVINSSHQSISRCLEHALARNRHAAIKAWLARAASWPPSRHRLAMGRARRAHRARQGAARGGEIYQRHRRATYCAWPQSAILPAGGFSYMRPLSAMLYCHVVGGIPDERRR